MAPGSYQIWADWNGPPVTKCTQRTKLIDAIPPVSSSVYRDLATRCTSISVVWVGWHLDGQSEPAFRNT